MRKTQSLSITLPHDMAKTVKDKVASGAYAEYLEQHNVPYRAEPVSILDIQQGRVKVDAQGYPKHVMLNQQEKGNNDGGR